MSENRKKKTMPELIEDYNNGIRPQIHQFILDDIIRFALEQKDTEFLTEYSNRRKTVIKGGVSKIELEKADEKYLRQMFRDKYFSKFEKVETEETKETKYTKRESMLLDIEKMLKAS